MRKGEGHCLGILPLTVAKVFRAAEEGANDLASVHISYLEIYNEAVHDLLQPGSPTLHVREDKRGMPVVQSLLRRKVHNADDVFKSIASGERTRHTFSTDYNAHSSRSHTIFQMVQSPNSSNLIPL